MVLMSCGRLVGLNYPCVPFHPCKSIVINFMTIDEKYVLLTAIRIMILYSIFHITDLSMAMQKIYQTFVALAAQLQSIHENVKVRSISSCIRILYNMYSYEYLVFLNDSHFSFLSCVFLFFWKKKMILSSWVLTECIIIHLPPFNME